MKQFIFIARDGTTKRIVRAPSGVEARAIAKASDDDVAADERHTMRVATEAEAASDEIQRIASKYDPKPAKPAEA